MKSAKYVRLSIVSRFWLLAVVLLFVGCGQPKANQQVDLQRQDEESSTATDDLAAAVEPEPIEPESNEWDSIEAIELNVDDLTSRGGLHPHSAAMVAVRESLNEPFANESAAASIKPPSLAPPRAAATQVESPAMPAAAAAPSAPFEHLPAGSTMNPGEKFARVKVFYATDRAPAAIPLSAYHITGQTQLLKLLGGVAVGMLALMMISWFRKRPRLTAASAALSFSAMAASVAFFVIGRTSIEKHGVNYIGDRGILTRGVCEVTVPVIHQKGIVERPTLLRFEFREDQDEHIVLTSAVELQKDQFYEQLSSKIDGSPDRDLLLFIHGYNVDFESAVQRTAQISVDLPFEGVPVCYSWPSQGKLLSYSIDENNAQWSVTHLREFLQELAAESGADSINVVAHSMGNRPMTGAMQQIVMRAAGPIEPMFDRVVLAAPDIDADQFRRDLAPSLLQVANQVTLYASSDDRALIASKKVHGHPRAGESGADLVVVPGIETIDVSGIDLSLLGHSYYGDNESMLRDLYEVVRRRLPAQHRRWLIPRQAGVLPYWQLARQPVEAATH
ncbi:MAG: alpha/beta hydrolase [Pirellulaceae bacterium]